MLDVEIGRVDAAYMPANARGEVSSRTRWPASIPPPSTRTTTKSSGLISTASSFTEPFFFERVKLLKVSARGRKKRSASSLEQNTEHSTGVIDTLRNLCRSVQGIFAASSS
jgi:hypothetical protein